MDTTEPVTYLEGATCRYCGHDRIRVEWRFVPKPVGTYSLSGVQTKVAAAHVPFAICGGCAHESQGQPD